MGVAGTGSRGVWGCHWDPSGREGGGWESRGGGGEGGGGMWGCQGLVVHGWGGYGVHRGSWGAWGSGSARPESLRGVLLVGEGQVSGAAHSPGGGGDGG